MGIHIIFFIHIQNELKHANFDSTGGYLIY